MNESGNNSLLRTADIAEENIDKEHGLEKKKEIPINFKIRQMLTDRLNLFFYFMPATGLDRLL